MSVVVTQNPYRLELTIAYLPPMNTAHTRRHWAVASKEANWARLRIRTAVGDNLRPPKPLHRARILCERHSSVMSDRGNVAQSFKPFVDALLPSVWKETKNGPVWIARANIIEDDNPVVLVEESYEWVPAPPKKGFIRIVVEEVVDG